MRFRLLVSMTLVLGAMVTALATPKYFGTFRKTYPTAKEGALAKASCNICHLKGTALNVFGKDVQKAMQAKQTKELTTEILKSIETLDSDKDGVDNGKEIRAGTLPGDPKSKPVVK